MPVIKTQKALLLESIPKMRHEIRFEMRALLERKGCAAVEAQAVVDSGMLINNIKKPLSEQDLGRFNILQTLKHDLETISTNINDNMNADDEGEQYRNELKTKIEAALLNPDVTKKYGCFKKLAILLLNIVTGVTVVPALIKKVTTGSFLYSFQGKSKEAVDETQKLFKKLSNDSAKLTKKKLAN